MYPQRWAEHAFCICLEEEESVMSQCSSFHTGRLLWRKQDVAWGPVLLSQGGEWARSMLPREARLWPLIIAPPAVGKHLLIRLQHSNADDIVYGTVDAGDHPRLSHGDARCISSKVASSSFRVA